MPAPPDLALDFGGATRNEIRTALTASGVQTNESAERLLALPIFDAPAADRVCLTFVDAATLNPAGPASFPTLMRAARAAGFEQPSLTTAPWLRLALLDQDDAPDSELSAGRSPSGSVIVASPPASDDDAFPKGFYLRRVDGVPWLRGHTFTDAYLFPPETVFALTRAAV